MPQLPATLIAHKRDGGEHAPDDIRFLVQAFLENELADYQMSAWLMAVYLRGLSDAEMIALTEAMLHSGTTLKRSKVTSVRIDKHSTGGVGDKVSLPLAPLVAACGVHVPMISGRGLGHTGGTLDKLESIPGYNTQLSAKQMGRVIGICGASIIGQTKNIAPADKRIYALRDVTATVACRPLIVASILSKKLAEDLDGLVLDVKVGRGAFMQDKKSALALAKSLVAVSKGLGTPAVARLTRMEEPLGRTIGNALEVKESIEILRGTGPSDTTELTLTLAEEMLLLAGKAKSRAAARSLAKDALDSGRAFDTFRQMVELHGGDPRTIDDPRRLPSTKTRLAVIAPREGTIQSVDSLALARLALELGAGRKRAEDKIDHAVGIELHVRVGERVRKGDRLATLHNRSPSHLHQASASEAFEIGSGSPAAAELLIGGALR
jgi:pyrimidine-nucleoside phosphorylase